MQSRIIADSGAWALGAATLMVCVVGSVISNIGKCGWGDGFFKGSSLFPSLQRCTPPALVMVEMVI
jgi:hypothetical protein